MNHKMLKPFIVKVSVLGYFSLCMVPHVYIQPIDYNCINMCDCIQLYFRYFSKYIYYR